MIDPHQTEEIYSQLLAEGYQERLFADFLGSWKKERGDRETMIDCPYCDQADHLFYSSERPVWMCWVCGEGGDWLPNFGGHPRERLQRSQGWRISGSPVISSRMPCGSPKLELQ